MKLGSSNKFFYYAMSDAKSFNLRYVLTFKQALDIDVMKAAVRKALDIYDEFSCRIIVRDNCFDCVHSTKMPFFHKAKDIWNAENFDLASEQLEGFPFFFQYTDKELLISYYHGMTDIIGMNTFIKSILYFYGLELELFSEEKKNELSTAVYCSKDQLSAIDDGTRYDPYKAYGDLLMQPKYVSEQTSAYYLQDDKKDHMKFEEIEINADDYSKEAGSMKSSFVGLTMALSQKAIRKCYETGNENVTVMLPVNQRPYFGSSGISTNVNCSDSIMVNYSASMSQKTLLEQCAYTKDCFDKAINNSVFIKMAGDKNKLVTDFENSGRSPLDISAEIQATYDDSGFNGLTYVITSPGRFVLPPALDGLLEDIDINSFAAAHSFWVYTFRNSFRIKYNSKNGSLILLDALKEELKSRGIKYRQKQSGVLRGDKLYLKDLKEVTNYEYRS